LEIHLVKNQKYHLKKRGINPYVQFSLKNSISLPFCVIPGHLGFFVSLLLEPHLLGAGQNPQYIFYFNLPPKKKFTIFDEKNFDFSKKKKFNQNFFSRHKKIFGRN